MDSQRKYENVSLEDHHSDSSTEVAESLLGDEKNWDAEDQQRSMPRSRTSRFMSRLKSSRWMVDTALLLVILGLLVRQQFGSNSKGSANEWDFGGDFTGVGPRCVY